MKYAECLMRSMRSLGTMRIETERLTLRRFYEEDAEMFFRNYGADPLVHRYVSFAPCKTIGGTRLFIHKHMRMYQSNDDFYGWAIVLDGIPIGSIGLFDVDRESESAEIGYSLGSAWWGKGYATEAVDAVLRFAFGEIGLHRVQATCHPENTTSERVLEKCGMVFEGTMREAQLNPDGSRSDLKLYAVLATDRRRFFLPLWMSSYSPMTETISSSDSSPCTNIVSNQASSDITLTPVSLQPFLR